MSTSTIFLFERVGIFTHIATVISVPNLISQSFLSSTNLPLLRYVWWIFEQEWPSILLLPLAIFISGHNERLENCVGGGEAPVLAEAVQAVCSSLHEATGQCKGTSLYFSMTFNMHY